MILVLFAAGISSCTAMFSSTGQTVILSSYLSEDDAMLDAEAQYCDMEAELQDSWTTTKAHDYDEYHFDLDTIEHDPYVLISILSALHEGEFTLSDVQGTMEMLFEKQYILTENVVVETRYRTETRVGTRTVTDPETGETSIETYTYEVQVPYDYYICYVTRKTSTSAMCRSTSCPGTLPCMPPICLWLAIVRICSQALSMWTSTLKIRPMSIRSIRHICPIPPSQPHHGGREVSELSHVWGGSNPHLI